MRVARWRFGVLIAFAAVAFGAAGPQVAVAAQYAAIVMDMRDGTVLYESDADRKQEPASLTKMMTLYLTFEAIRHGKISLDQNVRVSRHAASQPPSKLYLKAGQTVSIRSLIRAAAIKSANDAAVALAEAVGGSETEFAKLMTAKARQLGMPNTTFRNASGLPASGHYSTARDLARLGRQLFFDFPEYYNIFSRKSERAAGKRIWTTNRLLSSYPGADGIKTGYTRAAGYNLVASAHRGDKRIIAALLGGRSSSWRNARMAELLDAGFGKADTQVAMLAPRTPRAASADAPVPQPRPGTESTGFEALAEALTSRAVAATPDPTSPLAPLYAAVPSSRPAAEAEGDAENIPYPVRRPSYAVQLGTFDSRAIAVARVTEITLGADQTLASAAPVIDQIRGREGMAYRVRILGLAPQDAAEACTRLKQAGRDCITVPQAN
jgi:D-alanyl-D-alanine carboxypeptidase